MPCLEMMQYQAGHIYAMLMQAGQRGFQEGFITLIYRVSLVQILPADKLNCLLHGASLQMPVLITF